ncbi:MAG: PepSY-associated TM helix domain-containing protein, partial [Verrucomicrobiota bacterium]
MGCAGNGVDAQARQGSGLPNPVSHVTNSNVEAGDGSLSSTDPAAENFSSDEGNDREERTKFHRLAKVHVFLGLTIGLVWILQAITGAMLAFELELDYLTNRELFEVTETGTELTLNEQMNLVRRELPDLAKEVYLVGLMDYPGMATLMLAKPAGEAGPKDGVRIFVDPFAGEIKGTQNYKDSIMGKVYHFHRTLYLGKWGKWVTSTSGILLAGSVLCGILVWFTKRATAKKKEGRL